jgi:hypothetical protein
MIIVEVKRRNSVGQLLKCHSVHHEAPSFFTVLLFFFTNRKVAMSLVFIQSLTDVSIRNLPNVGKAAGA